MPPPSLVASGRALAALALLSGLGCSSGATTSTKKAAVTADVVSSASTDAAMSAPPSPSASLQKREGSERGVRQSTD